MRYYLRLLSLPLLFLVISVTLRLTWAVFSLPSGEEIAEALRVYFEQYGIGIVFAGAFLEGLLLVGGYFPGIFVIFLGVLLAESVGQGGLVVAAGTAGLYLAHLLNYTLGKHGWYRLLARYGLMAPLAQSKAKIEKSGPVAILSTFWLPSMSALTSTAAGILHMPLKQFLFWAAIGVVFWDTLAGTLFYLFKEQALGIVSPGGVDITLVLGIIVIWIIAILLWDTFVRRKRNAA